MRCWWVPMYSSHVVLPKVGSQMIGLPAAAFSRCPTKCQQLVCVDMAPRTCQVARAHLPGSGLVVRVNIDATLVANAARFINHACDGGNLQAVLVRRSGCLVPAVALFVARHEHIHHCSDDCGAELATPAAAAAAAAAAGIVSGEELTFAYGVPTAQPPPSVQGGSGVCAVALRCACGTPACLGYLPHA
jgi:hypothetical protein